MEVLQALEQSLFERTEESVSKKAGDIEKAMQESVFSEIDTAVADALKKTTLYDLTAEVEKQKQNAGLMFYI